MNRRGKRPSADPPQWINQILAWFCALHLLEEVQGDLHELYGKWVEKYGERKANRLYVYHTIKFLRPYSIKRLSIHNPTIMLKNYLLIAFRNLRRNKVYSALNIAGLAVGLASFTTVQRTKEIGVRKVLGASVVSIMTLITKDFMYLMIIAFLFAAPIAWYAMHIWLKEFSYKVDISRWIFAAAGSITFLIALLTVSFQSIKAALGNPVDSLRNE